MSWAISFIRVISYESSNLFDILTIPFVIGIFGFILTGLAILLLKIKLYFK